MLPGVVVFWNVAGVVWLCCVSCADFDVALCGWLLIFGLGLSEGLWWWVWLIVWLLCRVASWVRLCCLW